MELKTTKGMRALLQQQSREAQRLDCDMKGYDDVCSAPYVTASGDLFCVPCGRSMDAAEERMMEEEAEEWGWAWWVYPDKVRNQDDEPYKIG